MSGPGEQRRALTGSSRVEPMENLQSTLMACFFSTSWLTIADQYTDSCRAARRVTFLTLVQGQEELCSVPHFSNLGKAALALKFHQFCTKWPPSNWMYSNQKRFPKGTCLLHHVTSCVQVSRTWKLSSCCQSPRVSFSAIRRRFRQTPTGPWYGQH